MSDILFNKELRAARVELTSARRAFWTAALVPCFAGSAITLSAGMIVSVLSWTGLLTASSVLAYFTIGLLFSSFILMFLGAHCLDRRDAAERAERIERSRREGLVVKDYIDTWQK